MTQELVTYRVCDRCPGDTDAVTTDKFALNGYRYEIDLCREHSAQLYAQIMAWADRGTLVGEPTVFDKPKVYAPRPVEAPKPRVEQPVEVRREEMPATAERWRLTEHCLVRMRERGFDLYQVLMTCERPETVAPSPKDNSLEERVRGGVLVVVNPRTLHVVTVVSVAEQKASA